MPSPFVILSDRRESKNLRVSMLHSSRSVRRSFDSLTLTQDDSNREILL